MAVQQGAFGWYYDINDQLPGPAFLVYPGSHEDGSGGQAEPMDCELYTIVEETEGSQPVSSADSFDNRVPEVLSTSSSVRSQLAKCFRCLESVLSPSGPVAVSLCSSHERDPYVGSLGNTTGDVDDLVQDPVDELRSPSGSPVVYRPCMDTECLSGSSVCPLMEGGLIVEMAWAVQQESPLCTGHILCDPSPVAMMNSETGQLTSLITRSVPACEAPHCSDGDACAVSIAPAAATAADDDASPSAADSSGAPAGACREAASSCVPPALRSQHDNESGQVFPGALDKRVQLLSLGLENFEKGATQSCRRCSNVWDSLPRHKRRHERVSHDFASVTGRRAQDFDMHRNMLLDSLFANFPDVLDGYKRSEVVLLDCRALSDGNKDRWLKHHAGYHPKTLAGLVESKAWDGFWHDAHDSIMSALSRAEVSQVLVVCYCRVGRHRSVGARRLLHHCLRGVGLREVQSADLCGDDLWSHLCRGDHANCRQCHPSGHLLEFKQSIMERAFVQWVAFDGVRECCSESQPRHSSGHELCSRNELATPRAHIAFGSLSNSQDEQDFGSWQEDSASSLGWGDWGGDSSEAYVADTTSVQEVLHVVSLPVDDLLSLRAQHVASSRGEIEEQLGLGARSTRAFRRDLCLSKTELLVPEVDASCVRCISDQVANSGTYVTGLDFAVCESVVAADDNSEVETRSAWSVLPWRAQHVVAERWQVEEHLGSGRLPKGANLALWSKALAAFGAGSITADEYERRAVTALRFPCFSRFVDQISVVNARQIACGSLGVRGSQLARPHLVGMTSPVDSKREFCGVDGVPRKLLRARARFQRARDVRLQRRLSRQETVLRQNHRGKERKKRCGRRELQATTSTLGREAKAPRRRAKCDARSSRSFASATPSSRSVAARCAPRCTSLPRVCPCMSALKQRVVPIVALPSTWKRAPGRCFSVAGRRFCVTRRRQCVVGKERLVRAQILRKLRRDARLLRRRIREDRDAFEKQLRKKNGTRFLSEDQQEAVSTEPTFPSSCASKEATSTSETSVDATSMCSSDTSQKRDGSMDGSSMAVPAVPMAEEGRVPRRNRRVRFASTHFCCGPEAHLNCVDVACGSDCPTHSPRLSCSGLNPGGESCTSDVIVEDCTLLGGGMPSACREDDVL